MIKDRLVATIKDNSMRKKFLEYESPTLEKGTDMCIIQRTESQIRNMENQPNEEDILKFTEQSIL